ncbi:hypothetical protein AFFFEF_04224 [Methylorubrum extorquens]
MLRWSHPCLLQLSPTNHAKTTRLLADVLAIAKHECRLRPYWQTVKREFAAKPSDFRADECLMSKIVRRQRLTTGDAKGLSASGGTSAPDTTRALAAPLRGRFPTLRVPAGKTPQRTDEDTACDGRRPHHGGARPSADTKQHQSSVRLGSLSSPLIRRQGGPAGRPEAPRQVGRPADKLLLDVRSRTGRMPPRQIAVRPRWTAGRASSASSQRRTFGRSSIAMPCLPWNFAQVSAAMSAIEYASARYSWSASRRSRTP